ncbi:unnamed protein product [Durusdinium trenchii]|uniref:Uncharacterized protein n=1 Tax=Durusdinium trenchii TaxID=1381693 RepID=A0ABP0IWH1_9DINO
MASFHALLQQLVDAHEADLAQLQEKVEELQEELALLHCSECHQDVEVSSPSRHWALEGQHHAPPTLMGEEGFEPVIKIFGMEVSMGSAQLGLVTL